VRLREKPFWRFDMSMIMCKYGCLSDTDEFVEFGYDEETGEYICESCNESEEEEDLK
jgi:hypothetical protein